MSLSAAVVDALYEAGATREQIIAAVKADIAERLAAEESRLEAKRQGNRERQQRRRSKCNGVSRDVTHVTRDSRDTVSPIEELLTPSGTDSPDEASASSPSRQPITAAVEIWSENAAAAGWRIPAKMSANRHKALGNRLREHGLEGWRAAIARARSSPYLGGADPPTWFTFDWLLKAGNFLKLIEGNYDRRHTDNSDPTAVALQRLHAFSGGVSAVG